MMNRRKFLAFLAAGGVVTATGLWLPGQKLISIPKKPLFSELLTELWSDEILKSWYQSKYEQLLVQGYTFVDGKLIRNIQSPFPYHGQSIQSLLSDNVTKA